MEQNDTKEILKAIGGLSDKIDTEVGSLSEQITEQASYVDKRFDGVDKRFDGIDKRLNKIEATMVTKDYLDDKLADLSGDLVVLLRKEDKKLGAIIEELVSNKVISDVAAKRILAMDLFPQIQI